MADPQPRAMPALSKLPVPSVGPEDVLVAEDGTIYCGTGDGWIYRLDPQTGAAKTLVNSGGRVLGLTFLDDATLLVCDAEKGVLALDLATMSLRVLTFEVDGVPLTFCNNSDVAKDGTVYFSNSSTRNGIENSTRETLENIPTGSLFRRLPDGDIETLLSGLHFANGVCLAPDESFVLVAETAAARIMKYHLTGDRAGQSEIFVDQLPGLPDNLSLGSDGLIWVALVVARSKDLQRVQASPLWVRKLVARLPAFLIPSLPPFLRVRAYAADGSCQFDYEGQGDDFRMATGVREKNGKVYLGSLEESAIAVFEHRA
ncbi:SMP-30/gluconolactonase/LRE family protein [Sneathiella marina]|uniref:SMP-30/gluconolactonase/LRE family protein n=1 Tax=Sneathiella marina TaxID=2950108 RepID=A0ABY4W3Z3_9PROT|nr:SMP-30/gluconolactonase/LRE family protein [Sneathiella marina]USG60445.1 SMP-30/gluconolactonase/LRE family protein [Sneathiella marina]